MRQFATLDTRRIDGFEALHEYVVGQGREAVQIERGKLRGQVSRASINGLPIGIATFNLGVRSRGGFSKEQIAIGMLIASTGRVTRSSYESYPGDVIVAPVGSESDNRYYGGASMLMVSLKPAEIESMFSTEPKLGDPAVWRANHFKGNADTVAWTIPRLRSLVARLAEGNLSLTLEAAEFWKRAVIDAITANIVHGEPAERDGPLPSALRVVRQVEEYLDTQGTAPVHISSICNQVRISRRTLHRAFHDAIGIGPIAFLRHRQLCAIHTALRTGAPTNGTIADLAIQHGFLNVGRFSQYYRQLFGEYPSDTRLRAGALPFRKAKPAGS